jgi:hypothetical protein
LVIRGVGSNGRNCDDDDDEFFVRMNCRISHWRMCLLCPLALLVGWMDIAWMDGWGWKGGQQRKRGDGTIGSFTNRRTALPPGRHQRHKLGQTGSPPSLLDPPSLQQIPFLPSSLSSLLFIPRDTPMDIGGRGGVGKGLFQFQWGFCGGMKRGGGGEPNWWGKRRKGRVELEWTRTANVLEWQWWMAEGRNWRLNGGEGWRVESGPPQ